MTPIALTIAGSDSSGGAGIQADLKTFSALGVYGASVIAAITAQNTRGVTAVHDVPADIVRAQIDAVLSDCHVAAVKIGMLSNASVMHVVANALEGCSAPIVLDPVMVATTGAKLIDDGAVETLLERLLPRATLVTPNMPEAAALLGETIARDEDAMRRQAQRLLALGAKAVLLKGGHGSGENAVDLLVGASGESRLSAKRVATRNTHGTGCTLSSAIAAELAKGRTLTNSVKGAKNYVSRAIAEADQLQIGHGHGPVHHFHAFW